MKLISFPSIGQFSNTVKAIRERAQYAGKDENGQAIYDPSLPFPTIRAYGSVKLHGTNAGISYNAVDGIWAQSRERVITPAKDNSGFAFFVETHKQRLLAYFRQLHQSTKCGTTDTFTLYGEWCGPGINQGTAISQLPTKSLFLFAMKRTPEEGPATWHALDGFKMPEIGIYNIHDYMEDKLDIDFASPAAAQNAVIKMTEAIEAQCPVARAFGIEGIGEGIVYTLVHEGNTYRFKSKGEKHTTSKVKVLNPADPVKEAALHALVPKLLPAWRLDQAFQAVVGPHVQREKIGDFIRAVIADIMKEELDQISEAGLEPKACMGAVSKAAKDYFFARENEMACRTCV